jgi:hypothetical protein
VLLADSASGVGGQISPEDGGAAGLTGSVIAPAQAFQCPVDVVQHPSGLGQFGLITLFHVGRVTQDEASSSDVFTTGAKLVIHDQVERSNVGPREPSTVIM